MTLIDSLVGVASTAVERLTGLGGRAIGGKEGGAAGEFASVLASMTGAAPAIAAATGRAKELRFAPAAEKTGAVQPKGAAGVEGKVEGEAAPEDEASILSLLASSQGAAVAPRATDTGADTAPQSTDAGVAVESAGKAAVGPSDATAVDADAEVELAPEANRVLASAATSESAAAEPAASAEPVTAAVASAAPTADVRRVDRDLDELVPEFRRRLDRVVSRMKSEFGHAVTVVEAHRTQERQNFLFEQGRSRPGQVVTWTRNSNHTTGRAVDVLIDGTYDNAAGYARLAKIAAEEGLQTLGPRDPGHVELPRNIDGGGSPLKLAASKPAAGGMGQALAEALAAESAARPATPVQAAGLARVASVARVAEVARVAQVAQVARVARPGEVGRAAEAPRPAAPSAPSAPAIGDPAAAVLAARAGSAGDHTGSSAGGRRQGSDTNTPSAAELEIFRADPGIGRTFAFDAPAEAQLVTGTDAVQRAAQILALKDGASAAPINHLLLRLDSPGGGEDRIRVDLRGSTVGTTLNIENPGEAERLAARVGELRQSLESHGLEAESVRIRTTPVSTDRVEVSRAALTAAEVEAARTGTNTRSGSDSSQPRDGWKEAQGQQQARRESGDPRQRSRREQPQEENA